jgi:hypothetical protein
MELNKYKSGDEVAVRMSNPKLDGKLEWRKGVVIGVQTIHPNTGERHKPYPMVTVKTIRTYCKATPKYKWLEGSAKKVKVFVDNTLEFYDKKTTEGFIYESMIKLNI